MWDHLWDYFVETLMVLFLPLVYSYHAVSTDLFLNFSSKEATGLEQAGNHLLSPFQYLFAGRIAIEHPDGSIEFIQRYDYEHDFWKNTATSLAALPPSLALGCAVKGLSFFNEETRKRHASIKAAWNSKKIYQSNEEAYRKAGLDLRDPKEAVFHPPQGYLRREGEEHCLDEEKKLLKEIISLLNQEKIAWWVDCGTCLGTFRYGGIIPWDGDIDIAVLSPDFENVRRVLNQLDPVKYLVEDWSTRSHPQSYIKVFIRDKNSLIDIYHFEILPEKRQIKYILALETNMFFPEWWKIRERRFTPPVSFDTVFPLKKSLFDGIEVFIPADPEKYLQRYYGQNLAPAKIYDPVTHRYEKDLSHPYWQRAYAH